MEFWNKALTEVKKLIRQGANINQTDVHGRNGLMLAAKHGNRDIIEFLHSENDQLIHSQNINGDTAVTLACQFADLKTVELLKYLGADFKKTGYQNRNALMWAVTNVATQNREDIVKFLLSKFPKQLIERDSKNHTVFSLCSDKNTMELLLDEFFMQKQPRCCRKTSYISCENFKTSGKVSIEDEVFLVCCRYGFSDTVKMLLNDNFDINGNRKPISNWLKFRDLRDIKDSEGRNGFMLAVLNCDIGLMFYLKKYSEKRSTPVLTKELYRQISRSENLNSSAVKCVDNYGINCSDKIDEVFCTFTSKSNLDLTLEEIDSISQVGALRQKRLVKRLQKNVNLLSRQNSYEYQKFNYDRWSEETYNENNFENEQSVSIENHFEYEVAEPPDDVFIAEQHSQLFSQLFESTDKKDLKDNFNESSKIIGEGSFGKVKTVTFRKF